MQPLIFFFSRCFVQELFQFLEKRNAISRVVIGCMNNLSLDEKYVTRAVNEPKTLDNLRERYK